MFKEFNSSKEFKGFNGSKEFNSSKRSNVQTFKFMEVTLNFLTFELF